MAPLRTHGEQCTRGHQKKKKNGGRGKETEEEEEEGGKSIHRRSWAKRKKGPAAAAAARRRRRDRIDPHGRSGTTTTRAFVSGVVVPFIKEEGGQGGAIFFLFSPRPTYLSTAIPFYPREDVMSFPPLPRGRRKKNPAEPPNLVTQRLMGGSGGGAELSAVIISWLNTLGRAEKRERRTLPGRTDGSELSGRVATAEPGAEGREGIGSFKVPDQFVDPVAALPDEAHLRRTDGRVKGGQEKGKGKRETDLMSQDGQIADEADDGRGHFLLMKPRALGPGIRPSRPSAQEVKR